MPQGAPTSPFISNIIARDLDKRLYLLCRKFELTYSRYADDLTFSGKRIPAIFIQYVTKIVASEGFSLNEEKTRLYRTKGKRIVTGLSVIGDVPKVPRKYKRELRQQVHCINKFGIESHIGKTKVKDPNYLESIIGKLSFWLSVEPENTYARESLQKMYKIKNEIGHAIE